MIERHSHHAQRIADYLKAVPFIVDPQEIYTTDKLYAGLDLGKPETFSQCYDQQVYNHFLAQGKVTDNPLEALARNLHDFCMMQSTKRLLAQYDKCKVVAVMGGNAMRRDDAAYEKIARISKCLTEKGSLMVSGGGSGAMEATGFGAWMAGRNEEEFTEALSRLKVVPTQEDTDYLQASFSIIKDYPQTTYRNLSIPTWLYGHEWTSPFATHIAKYFDNSTREDSILTIAKGGVIYSPGSAGTMQEIFQDAVQNHYLSFGYASPMIFIGEKYWTEEMPVYKLMEHLVNKGKYKNLLLSITDSIEQVINTITEFKTSRS